MTEEKHSYGKSRSGVKLTDKVIECMAAEAEAGLDVTKFRRRPGRPRQRVKDLRRGMLIAALLEAHVVVGADARQQRHLLASQPGHAPASREIRKPNLLGPDQFTAGTQILANQIVLRHRHNDTPERRPDPGPAATRISRSLVQAGPPVKTGGMTRTDTTPRITTRFGFDSTAAEVIAGIDLSGKTVIVTGASSGIGVETARALASAGAAVTLAVRDMDAGERTAADIAGSTGNRAVHIRRLDLADQASVTAFAADWTGPLHLLVNNAGVMALPELQLTPEGWELQFATNHLGHFALALGLRDALAAARHARIVSLSSRGHQLSPVIFDDINFTSRPYGPWLAYGQSKTANILFAVEATRRWTGDGITTNAVHPGAIAATNLSRHVDPEELANLRSSGRFRYKTIEQGAATSVLVATSPQLEGIGGRYFEDCNEALLVDPDALETSTSGVAGYALDPDNARRLWELSLGMLGR